MDATADHVVVTNHGSEGWTATRTVELPVPLGKSRITLLASVADLEGAGDDGPPRLRASIVASGATEHEARLRALTIHVGAGHADPSSVTFRIESPAGDPEPVARATVVLWNPPPESTVEIAAARGDVTWRVIRHAGSVRLTSGQGGVAVVHHEGGSLIATSSNGNVTLHHVAASVEVTAFQGNVVVRTYRSAPAPSLRLLAMHGDATLDITQGWADAGKVSMETDAGTRPTATVGTGCAMATITVIGGNVNLVR